MIEFAGKNALSKGALKKNKAKRAVGNFFIQAHHFCKIIVRERAVFREGDGQVSLGQEVGCSAEQVSFDPPKLCGHVRRHRHANRDCFTVKPAPVSHSSFDGMAKGVAQIEGRPHPGLSLVRCDNFRLEQGANDGR